MTFRAMGPTWGYGLGGSPTRQTRQTTIGSFSGARSRSSSPAARPDPLVYQITPTTELHLLRGDITRYKCDAIVNAGALSFSWKSF